MTMLTYQVSSGKLYGDDGEVRGVGYSGLAEAKNDPGSEGVEGKGPIPRGIYHIGAPYNSDRVGPYALPLTPVEGNMFGRSAFRIHGDSIKHPGTASHGCIILPRTVREWIVSNGVNKLQVI